MKKILLTLAVLIPIAWGMNSHGDHSTDSQSIGHIDGEARYIEIVRTDSFFDDSSDALLLQAGHAACQALKTRSVDEVVAAAADNIPDFQAGEVVGATAALCPEFTAKLQAYAG